MAGLFPRTASVYTAMEWFKQRGRWSAYPAIGAMCIYGTSGSTHTGICYAYDETYIYTVEGNTSLTNDANGNKVMRRQRLRRDSYVHGYGYPAYVEGITTADPSKKGLAGYTYAASASSPATSSGGSTGKYRIKAGQTLGGIAALLGVSLAALLAANPQIRDPDQVDEGQEISVPAKPAPDKPTTPPAKPTPEPSKPMPPQRPATNGDFYTVRSGDSLSGIARSFEQSLSALLARNPQITDPNVIQAGQKIRVTGSTSAQEAASRATAPRHAARKAITTAKTAKATVGKHRKPAATVVQCHCSCPCCGAPKLIPQPTTGPADVPKPVKPSEPPKPPKPPTTGPTPTATASGPEAK
ncbi:LysM peptidoglycan-binding domain-containing protein [Streptomyces sp. NPDC052101]|uniref:LysM peptidoglycan-binding domain-containing protein n=1 Tax=Streptomyces sp. NPDC052101 TaxID=3155763 RepID=UPI003422E6D8